MTQTPPDSHNIYSIDSNISPMSFPSTIVQSNNYPQNQYSYSFTPHLANANQLTTSPTFLYNIMPNFSSSNNTQQESNPYYYV